MALNSDTIAANAYGVIGAVTTVTVNSKSRLLQISTLVCNL